ncbi:uncharacterized protein J4E84_008745 [Alternaria hordeiaustralica]|uniref:uncharacterized protein n=1 Tax=Alternaria hordeiaustralica TaxID=1187925 RepID=UPI0020C55AFA|nr:uncharacterized protein J4E84_008745 [Alternaria hordeiaustralica]KAI4678489.1 hypothetical protein J4E84_008745 [Alternaria hordeiaustralica]
MSSQRYSSIGVPGALAWEMEEYESEYRLQGRTTEVSSTSLLSEHGFTSEDDHQQDVDSTEYQQNVNINPCQHNASVHSYPQNFGAGAVDQPPEVHLENQVAGLTSEHIDSQETDAFQNVDFISFGQPLRRFYFRTIVGILGPVIVVSYLITIWRIYLAPLHPESTVAFGPPGAKWVFYSWFVAGVIGLSLSLYGLAGAEAGMLMERTWRVEDAMRLMLHADNTWSGPGGWMKAIKWVVQIRRKRNQHSKLPSPLWFVLALPSVVVFVAWPLSGLCLEMTSGFLHDKPGQGANVTGFVQSTFNAVPGSRRPSRRSYITARVLGHGAVYTPENFDRSKNEFLKNVPVILPNAESVEEIFLTAQGETPIEGKAWGLLLHYDCKIVDKLSDFVLLKDRRSSTDVWGSRSILPDLERMITVRRADQDSPIDEFTTAASPLGPTDSLAPAATSTLAPVPSTVPNYMSYRLHDNKTFVEIRKEPAGGDAGYLPDLAKGVVNIGAVIETAYQSLSLRTGSNEEPPCGWLYDMEYLSTSYCYHNLQEDPSKPYPGIEHKRAFEVLLWQTLFAPTGSGNITIDRTIESLTGEYIDGEERLGAIGVSCTSSSSVGSANIDGVRSTYSNFQRSDTPVPTYTSKNDCAKRFSAETLACTLNITEYGWLKWLFDSIGLPSPVDLLFEDPTEGAVLGITRFDDHLYYLQADQLRQVLLQAYSTYAIKLMYNDGRDFIAVNGTHLESHVPDLTAFVAGTVIEPGVMPAAVPVALFGLWALISSGLCLLYGFRRRWSAILDGHTVFRLGAELQQTYRAKLQRYSTIADIEECEALHKIPGFVADMDADDDVGRIGLMDGKPARKDKFYR